MELKLEFVTTIKYKQKILNLNMKIIIKILISIYFHHVATFINTINNK